MLLIDALNAAAAAGLLADQATFDRRQIAASRKGLRWCDCCGKALTGDAELVTEAGADDLLLGAACAAKLRRLAG